MSIQAHLQAKLFSYSVFLPEWGASKLSSSSSPKILPRLTGLLLSAAPTLLPPSSASSTGTTVKLVGILDVYLPSRKCEKVSSDIQDGTNWTFAFTRNRSIYKKANEKKQSPVRAPVRKAKGSVRAQHGTHSNTVVSFLFVIWSSGL